MCASSNYVTILSSNWPLTDCLQECCTIRICMEHWSFKSLLEQTHGQKYTKMTKISEQTNNGPKAAPLPFHSLLLELTFQVFAYLWVKSWLHMATHQASFKSSSVMKITPEYCIICIIQLYYLYWMMFDELRSGRCEISRLLQYKLWKCNWSELGDDLVGTNWRQACAVVRSEGPSSGKTFRVNHWDYLRLILESAEGLNPTHLEVYHNAGHQRISSSQCTLGQLMGLHALWTLHCSVHWKFPAAKTQSRSHELCELQEASLQNKENPFIFFKTNSHERFWLQNVAN